MTAQELYTKFVENSRKPQKIFIENRYTRNSIRSSLYALRKTHKETFAIVQKNNTLTIADRILNI